MLKLGQVGMDYDHFSKHTQVGTLASHGFLFGRFMSRVRHCVECPKCLTRYLIAFSPYNNGAYVVPTMYGSSEEYTLYCYCAGSHVVSRWRWSETMVCEVSKAAYERGYGTAEEMMAFSDPPSWSFNVSRCLSSQQTSKRRPPR